VSNVRQTTLAARGFPSATRYRPDGLNAILIQQPRPGFTLRPCAFLVGVYSRGACLSKWHGWHVPAITKASTSPSTHRMRLPSLARNSTSHLRFSRAKNGRAARCLPFSKRNETSLPGVNRMIVGPSSRTDPQTGCRR
jgi:hypothetical protein